MTHRGTGRKHVHGQHVKCKHTESHDAHRSGAHKANVEYKPKYMSKGQQSCLSLLSQSECIYVMEAGESQVFVSIKMKQRTRMMQVSRNMEEGDWARNGGSDDENAYKPVFLENESSDYTAVFGRLRESLRTKHLQRPVFTVREGSTHSRTRHT